MNANISNEVRKAIYRREGYECAICGGTRSLQIHHVYKRSQGGKDTPHNLICLCMYCHALVHGTMNDGYMTQEDAEQAITEYLADYYMDEWDPCDWPEFR